MRVSTQMMYGSLSERLGIQATRLLESQEQIASGQRLMRPSDDPAAAGQVVVLDNRLADLEQYQSNAAAATGLLSAAESAIAQATQAFRAARNLALAGANDTVSESERRLMASQISRLIGQVQQAAETRYAGRYLFAGTHVRTSPLAPTGDDMDPFAYAGNDGQRLVEIADGVTVASNVTGRAVFNFDGAGVPDAPNAFAALAKIRDYLEHGDAKGLSSSLDDLDALLENFNKHRAEIGQKMQRIEFNQSHLQTQEEVLTELRADVTGADLAKALVEYRTREITYQATIALSARIDQPGLFELLRP